MLHPYTRILCESCGTVHVIPVYCGNRFCPVCQGARLSRVRDRLNWLVKRAKDADTRGFRHLTLTIVSQTNLPLMIDRLIRSFKKLRSKPFWRKLISGGAYVVEVTRSNAGWHAHIHTIIQSDFVPWTELRNLWLKISGSPGCYIQRIPASAITSYLTKYLTKPELEPDDLPTANAALKNVRLFNPYGKWHAISRDYRRPLHPCAKCGKSGTWTLYAMHFSGQIVEMLESTTGKAWDVATVEPRGQPVADEVAPF